jgi:hypothetical protein
VHAGENFKRVTAGNKAFLVHPLHCDKAVRTVTLAGIAASREMHESECMTQMMSLRILDMSGYEQLDFVWM